jgi:hypothetical protein
MKVFKLILNITLILLLTACANRAAGPTGGPKDSIPPVIIKTVPLNGSVNYKKKEVLIYFDENINVEKANENVIVSPPQLIQPVVKGNGKVLSLSLQDELVDETSYSIVFNNAIVDLNERNPYPSYIFSFSTGNEIDTLKIQGKLTDAFNADPVPNVIVGIHPVDSVDGIFKSTFRRITKTDKEGRFTIENVKQGAYRVYALNDINKDYRYQQTEQVAFLDSVIIPEISLTEKADTIRKNTISGDSVVVRKIFKYSPDNLRLRLFKDARKRQYLVKSERTDKHKFQLFFNRPNVQKPAFRFIDSTLEPRILYRYNAKNDTIIAWIKDEKSILTDTLNLEVRYQKTDSLFNLIAATDTVKLIFKPVNKQSDKNKNKIEEEAKSILPEIKSNIQSQIDPNADLIFYLSQPADSVDVSKIGLYQKIDTLMQAQKFELLSLDSVRTSWRIKYNIKPGSNYEFRIDSAAISDIYGMVNVKYTQKFAVKALEDYSVIKLNIQNPDTLFVIQVIDSKENLIVQKRVKGKDLRFEFLKPGDYFLKLFVDRNMNDLWDSGILREKIQPEEVVYFSKKLTLKANWEVEESWDPKVSNDEILKPVELMKEQPKK